VYSLCIGLGLFLNGTIFRNIEKRYISWVKWPVKSFFIALTVHLVYSSFIIIFFNWLWFIKISGNSVAHFLSYGWFIIIGEYISFFLISAIIYARSFFIEYREEAIQAEKLKQEAMGLQYQVMQNQVNPHFLFNALNVIGSLIDVDTEKAKSFIRELSLFYRELLLLKDTELVSVREELNFVKKYIFLQKIRFGDNFNVDIFIPEDMPGKLVPMSLQMMLENAVKHNVISKNEPLRVVMGKTDNGELFVENNLQPKSNVSGSNRIGLDNLRARYQYLTNKEMQISKNEHFFRVTIPLINIGSYAGE
jgi:LytS/YehU family sensor histidine kinase